MTRQGTAIVVSAPSGTGKSTLCNMLLTEFSNIHYSVSCTTRQPRQNEKDGVNYFFISKSEFERKRAAGDFAEWAEVHGNLYGTPLEIVRQKLNEGQDILFDIDVQGAAQIKITLPDTYFIFIVPPSMAELEKRLRGRQQDDGQEIVKRLRNAKEEIREALWYDSLILNDDLKTAYEQLRAVYITTTLAPGRNTHLINNLLADTNLVK